MDKKREKELLEKIVDLERRVRELEAHPPTIINLPATYPVFPSYPIPVSPPEYPWLPYNQCSAGTYTGATN